MTLSTDNMDPTRDTASNTIDNSVSANRKSLNASNSKNENGWKSPNPKAKASAPSTHAQNDPDSMFKGGFLADVYSENPVRSDGKGRVVTRFPPEPNGFLHLGHTKAIMINFGFARFHGGDCYLRFDDTNPTGEEEKYFVAIEEMIRWLGFKPVTVTHSSDNFDRLYELAEELINNNGAYVCHCTKEEVVAQRGGGKGKASFEGVTHSLCTTEFELSRVSYEWLCDKVAVYKPMQREFGRLRISGTVLSKRKILALIENNHVNGWDDPRLYTLTAIRRRGVPPEAILSFVNELGVTKAETTIDIKRFEQCVRRYLEVTVPRLMLVLDPIPVVIDNIPEDYIEMVELPFSKDPAFGVHTVPFTKTVYIERSDFRESASKDFFRLAPGTSVGLLKVPFPITATGFETDPETGLVAMVHAHYEKPDEGTAFKKPKSYIHWVAKCPSKDSPVKATVRIFNPLFKSNDPDTVPGGFLSDVNARTEEIFPNAMVETGIEEIKKMAPWPRPKEGNTPAESGTILPETVRFQGMRVAYFCLDRDSSEKGLVLNRIWAKGAVRRAPSPPGQYSNVKFLLINPSKKVEEEHFGIERYYPARIGDILSSRYQIVGKLGFGNSSTVWLSRDLQSHRHVAVKIFTNDSQDTDEIAIYKHISQGNKSRLGYRYVRTALDSFELTNRGRKHPCLVHEPLWDSVRTLLERIARDNLTEDLLRVILQRLFVALDYLHTDRKLIHTDIKSDNILHLIEDASILAAFEKAEIAQPSPRKESGDREIYISRTLDMPKSIGEPVLCDFGSATYGTKINDYDAYPDIYRCPEVMLHLPWSYSADIWNVGAMIWDIFEGKHLFSGQDPKRGRYTTRAHLTELISILGPPPLELIKLGKRSPEWFDGDGKWLEPDENEPERLPLLPSSSLEAAEENLKGTDKELFLNFIKSMLQWEPEKRKTARELLDDPWLSKSQ
ncbi:hypothetical protein V495_01801, partial [Pseudogymnoascus sp. VKM F-4514 (FW-929)]